MASKSVKIKTKLRKKTVPIFEQRELLGDVFLPGNKYYIIFEHRDKIWILPYEHIRSGLGMYQPTTKKGIILKKMLPFFAKIKWIRRLIRAEKKQLSLQIEIQKYLDESIGEGAVYYVAGYMGDFSAEENDKLTLQVYNENHIITYLKITKNRKAGERFQEEMKALQTLRDKGVCNIPRILWKMKNGREIMFAQSTKKSVNEKVQFVFDRRHTDFVKNMNEITERTMQYEKTDFYRNVTYVKEQQAQDGDGRILNRAIRIIEKELAGKEKEYGFSHGDYTPWNVYYADGELQVFDFEYCSFSKPCYIDIFHYLTQMSLLGCGNDGKQTILLYEKKKELIEKYVHDADFTYMCYLIDIIGFYKKRTIRRNKVVDKEYGRWIAILEYLINRWEYRAA